MKDPADSRAPDLPGLAPKRGRGRPRKPDALTPAQRAKRYRRRKAWTAMQAKRFAEVRYIGPNGETWSGRGLMPRWVTAALERGITLASMERGRRDGNP